MAPGILDHCPMVMKIMSPPRTSKPFKFFNYWTTHPDFSNLVAQVWDSPLNGNPMFILCSKLRLLKCRLKQLNKESFSDISSRTVEARIDLRNIQDALHNDPLNLQLAEAEKLKL